MARRTTREQLLRFELSISRLQRQLKTAHEVWAIGKEKTGEETIEGLQAVAAGAATLLDAVLDFQDALKSDRGLEGIGMPTKGD